MSEHNAAKIRVCRHCGARNKLTAKQIKEHAEQCARRNKKAA